VVALVTTLAETQARARLVREDTALDAAAVDRTPFTPRGLGMALGAILAQIGALAKCIEELCEERS
jgi:hypothetical protein